MKTKVTKHIPPRYSLFTIWMFDGIGNKHNVYRGENCMKKNEILREYSKNISNFGKKKEIPLTNGNNESYEKTKSLMINIVIIINNHQW